MLKYHVQRQFKGIKKGEEGKLIMLETYAPLPSPSHSRKDFCDRGDIVVYSSLSLGNFHLHLLASWDLVFMGVALGKRQADGCVV